MKNSTLRIFGGAAPLVCAVALLAGGQFLTSGGSAFGHHESVTLVGAAGLVIDETEKYTTCVDSRSLVLIEGTSTLHDWTVRGRIVEGVVRIPGGFPVDRESLANGAEAIEGELSIPSATLRSFRRGRPYSTRMDDIMYEKLLVDEHPAIHYSLEKIELKAAPATRNRDASGPIVFETTGKLTVAGVGKDVAIPLGIERLNEGSLRLTGKVDLKMSDFKIDPPVALAGTIRTGDAISVSVEWVVRKE